MGPLCWKVRPTNQHTADGKCHPLREGSPSAPDCSNSPTCQPPKPASLLVTPPGCPTSRHGLSASPPPREGRDRFGGLLYPSTWRRHRTWSPVGTTLPGLRQTQEADRAEIAPDAQEEPALRGSLSLRPVTSDLRGRRGGAHAGVTVGAPGRPQARRALHLRRARPASYASPLVIRSFVRGCHRP